MQTADYEYELPSELIAQHPTEKRDSSRLLVLTRAHGRIDHRGFSDFPELLRSGDTLVINNSRVMPARLRAVITATGARIEVLLMY